MDSVNCVLLEVCQQTQYTIVTTHMWGHSTDCWGHENLGSQKCFWIFNDQKLIQKSICNASKVSWLRYAHHVVLCNLGFEHTCTLHSSHHHTVMYQQMLCGSSRFKSRLLYARSGGVLQRTHVFCSYRNIMT